jgi:hypothetical protein
MVPHQDMQRGDTALRVGTIDVKKITDGAGRPVIPYPGVWAAGLAVVK